MTRELVIDVNKARFGTRKPDFLATTKYADFPIFAEFMDSYEKGEEISLDLKERMKQEVVAYKEANPFDFIHDIKEVHEISSGKLALEKVLAVAINEIENERDYREATRKVLEEIKQETKTICHKDFKRDGVLINFDGKKVKIQDDNISELFPELTGEQCGFILNMANQSMMADSGMRELAQVTIREEKKFGFNPSEDIDNLFCSLSIRDGKVMLTSSKNFNLVSMEVSDEQGHPKSIGKIQSSFVADITDLKGEGFKIGKAAGRAKFQVGYRMLEGDDRGIIESIRKSVQNPEISVNQNLDEFRSQIALERMDAGQYQKGVRKDGAEKALSLAEIKIRQSKFEDLQSPDSAQVRANMLKELNHSPEFIADMMGSEHKDNSKLWKAYKGNIKGASFDKEPESKYAASAAIYSHLQKDKAKKVEYGAKKLVQATKDLGAKIDSKNVVSIFKHLVPSEKGYNLESNAGMIARASVQTKNLSFGDRVLKVADKCKIALGLVSQDVSKIVSTAREAKKGGRKVKAGGFVERLLKQRAQAKGIKSERGRS